VTKWKKRGLIFALTFVLGVLLPYALMSGCENGFAVLAPTDDFQCTHSLAILRSTAEELWGVFVLSSFLLGLPILLFWGIVWGLSACIVKVVIGNIGRNG